MKYIKAILTIKIPKDRLNIEERKGWENDFAELKREMTETAPPDVIATLTVEEVDE